MNKIDLGACEEFDFAVMAGSAATCAGAAPCDVTGGLGVSPGTSITGNFDILDISTTQANEDACATAGLAAWSAGTTMTGGAAMFAEMGGVTFTPGLHTHGSAINIALANPVVFLDADGDDDAVFIFQAGDTLTTCAGSKIVLQNGAKAENVYWVLGTALTMGADSLMVGTVLAGSAITIGTNGMILGRAIAQTAVTCATGCYVESSAGSSTDLASAEFNFSIAYGGAVDLGECAPWADRLNDYVINTARTSLKDMPDSISWTYENLPAERRNLREESRELCGWEWCQRCKNYGFPYCNDMYWCMGCRRALTVTDERELQAVSQAVNIIENGCEYVLHAAGNNAYPHVGLSQLCMDALEVVKCKAMVQQV